MVCYFNIHTTALLCPLCCENENWGANITPNMRLWNYSKFANINMSTGYTLCLENGGGYTKSIDMGWKHVRWTPHTRLQSPPKTFSAPFLTASSDTVNFAKQATGYTWTFSDTKKMMKKTSRKKAPYHILGRNTHTLSPLWSPPCENENFWDIMCSLWTSCL